ncbi:hypothetical protein CMK15_00375 [Candidatus Poribacteria bacterium]|nr:hypothetical protein [Candidatus Poribacteria bacterium]
MAAIPSPTDPSAAPTDCRFADADQITSTTGKQSWPAEKNFPQRESRPLLRDIDFTVTCHTFVFSAKNCN